jgi:hypothetical protein
VGRKYLVECPFPNCKHEPFINKARHKAIEPMKTHARVHGVDYKTEEVEYKIKEFNE